LIGAIRDITRRKQAELKLDAASKAAANAQENKTPAITSILEGMHVKANLSNAGETL
jgi:hypothetical protein